MKECELKIFFKHVRQSTMEYIVSIFYYFLSPPTKVGTRGVHHLQKSNHFPVHGGGGKWQDETQTLKPRTLKFSMLNFNIK